jgi:hypothetical protein
MGTIARFATKSQSEAYTLAERFLGKVNAELWRYNSPRTVLITHVRAPGANLLDELERAHIATHPGAAIVTIEASKVKDGEYRLNKQGRIQRYDRYEPANFGFIDMLQQRWQSYLQTKVKV